MPQPNPSHIDLLPLNLLRYDAEMGMWDVYDNKDGSLYETDRSPLVSTSERGLSALAFADTQTFLVAVKRILNCAYELYRAEHPQITIPLQFTTHWCNWCRFSGDPAKVSSVLQAGLTSAHSGSR